MMMLLRISCEYMNAGSPGQIIAYVRRTEIEILTIHYRRYQLVVGTAS
jgi:hypothetical protein